MAIDDRPLDVNMSTVARFGAGGALGGAALASAVNLVHMLKDLNERRMRAAEPSETNEDTIVLTIPRHKQACACGRKPCVCPATHVTRSGPRTAMKPAMAGRQVKHHDGQFGHSVRDHEKQANWQTLAASMLALGGAGTLGYMVADKVYNRKREKEKERELQQSRQEYMDLLTRNATKTAAETGTQFNTPDYLLGSAALAMLLGSGATAWLTKRVLDEYAQDHAKPRAPRPEIKRIVFKSAAEMDDGAVDKEAADTAQALVGVFMDIMSGEPAILGDPGCAEQLKLAGTDADTLYKLASGSQDDYRNLMTTMESNPELRRTIQRLSMEKHPVLRHFEWAVGLPGVSNVADNRLYAATDKAFNPDRMAKAAAALPIGGLVGTLTGSAMVGNALENTRVEQKLEELIEAMRNDSEDKKRREQEGGPGRSVDVAAADPRAAEFLGRNQDRIRAAVLALEQNHRI